jgi:hypothetical protein
MVQAFEITPLRFQRWAIFAAFQLHRPHETDVWRLRWR